MPPLHALAFALITGMRLAVPAQAPLHIRDTATTHTWRFTRALGGGAEFTLMPRSAPSAAFLNGAGFRLRLGCDSFDPARRHWKFQVDVLAPATDLTGEEERAFNEGVRRVLAGPAEVLLFDDMDKVIQRITLVEDNGKLTSLPLQNGQISLFHDAAQLRVETPRLVLEAAAHGLYASLVVTQPHLACAQG